MASSYEYKQDYPEVCQSQLVCSSCQLICSKVAYSIIASYMDPDQNVPCGSSLLRVHIVCFYEKVCSALKYLAICLDPVYWSLIEVQSYVVEALF